MIDCLLVTAFAADAILMSLEDLKFSSVPLSQALALLLLAIMRLLLSGTRETLPAMTPTSGDLVCLLTLIAMVAQGRTGIADLLFLVSLRIFYPEKIIIRRVSLFISGEAVGASIAEVSFANGILLALRHRVLVARGGREQEFLRELPQCVILFAPLIWLLPSPVNRQVDRVPFIPLLAGGAVIGVLLNALLL